MGTREEARWVRESDVNRKADRAGRERIDRKLLCPTLRLAGTSTTSSDRLTRLKSSNNNKNAAAGILLVMELPFHSLLHCPQGLRHSRPVRAWLRLAEGWLNVTFFAPLLSGTNETSWSVGEPARSLKGQFATLSFFFAPSPLLPDRD